MKDSYFKTPRTLAQAQFYDWGQAVFHDPSEKHFNFVWIIIALIIGGLYVYIR